MKTNLLLLDSYENIENLLSYAFSFSNNYERKLKIAYVFDLRWMNSYMLGASAPMSAGLAQVEKAATEEFKTAESKIKSLVEEYFKHNMINIQYEIKTSKTNRITLVEEEFKKDKDLMLLVSNHQSYSELSNGLIRYPNIIEHVKCPVYVIPKNAVTHILPRNVVYAADYNPEDITSLKHLSGFLKRSAHANITVLHNEKDTDFDKKIMWKGFMQTVKEEVDFDNFDFALENRKDFLKGMEEYSSENNTDLLVLLHEKKGFFDQIFSSNEVKNVLTNFDKPVLVYHEK